MTITTTRKDHRRRYGTMKMQILLNAIQYFISFSQTLTTFNMFKLTLTFSLCALIHCQSGSSGDVDVFFSEENEVSAVYQDEQLLPIAPRKIALNPKRVPQLLPPPAQAVSYPVEQHCEEERLTYLPRHLTADCMCDDSGHLLDCYNSVGTHFFKLPNPSVLQKIRLHKSDLSTIEKDTFNAPSVTSLEVTFCGLTLITPGSFGQMTNLKYLDLSFNAIFKLDEGVFSLPRNSTTVSKLEYVNLSNNQLSYFDPQTFAGLINLVEIDLSNNKLTAITNIFPMLPKLRKVRLGHNYFRAFEADLFLDPVYLPSLSLISAERCDVTMVKINLARSFKAVNSSKSGVHLDVSFNPRMLCSCDLFVLQHFHGVLVTGNCQYGHQDGVLKHIAISKVESSVCSGVFSQQASRSVDSNDTTAIARNNNMLQLPGLTPADLIPIGVVGILVAAVAISIIFSCVVICNLFKNQREQQKLLAKSLENGTANGVRPGPGNEEVFYSADMSKSVVLISAKRASLERSTAVVATEDQVKEGQGWTRNIRERLSKVFARSKVIYGVPPEMKKKPLPAIDQMIPEVIVETPQITIEQSKNNKLRKQILV